MNTTFNKILLSQNDFLINEAIKHEAEKLQTLNRLPAFLKPFGLDSGEVKKLSWNEIDNLIKDTFLFPKATEEHNLNCMGLTKSYADLKEFHRLNNWAFDAKILTQVDKDAIIEKYRIYSTNDNQNEAFSLVNNVVDSLNRLKELGITIDAGKLYTVSRIFDGDNRETPAVFVHQENLMNTLIKLN